MIPSHPNSQTLSFNSAAGSKSTWVVLVRCLTLVGVLSGSADRAAAQDDAKLHMEDDKKTLREHNIGADAESLLNLFRQHTLTEQDFKNINLWLSQLSSDSYNVREKAVVNLIKAGPTALPQLRQLLSHSDQETYLRAKRCIEVIESKLRPEIYHAAARLLRQANPPMACPVLFDYLPYSVNDEVRESVLAALWTIGVDQGKIHPVLIKGLADAQPVRRAAAALIVAKAGKEEQRKLAGKLLHDADPNVRLSCAHGLLLSRDVSGVPILLVLLREGPYPCAEKTEELLILLAGDTAPDVHLRDDPQVRQQCHAAWHAWWQRLSNGPLTGSG